MQCQQLAHTLCVFPAVDVEEGNDELFVGDSRSLHLFPLEEGIPSFVFEESR